MATQPAEKLNVEGGGSTETLDPQPPRNQAMDTEGETVIDLTMERNNKRPPPKTSHSSDLQAEQKKLHREDSSQSTSSTGEENMSFGDHTNTGTDKVSESGRKVRQKLYSEALARACADASFPVDLDTLGVDDSHDSLLLNLVNLAGNKNSPHPGTEKSRMYFTPMIRNLFDPDHHRQLDGEESKKSPNTTAYCVAENNLFLRSISKLLESMSDSLSNRLDRMEKSVDNDIKECKSRLIAGEEERLEMKNLIGKGYDYTDEKFKILKTAIPITIDELGVELEKKAEISRKHSSTETKGLFKVCEEEIASVKTCTCNIEKVFTDKLTMLENKQNTEMCALRQRVDKLASYNCPQRIERLESDLKDYQGRLESCERRLAETNQRLEQAVSNINNQSNATGGPSDGFIREDEYRNSDRQQKRLDDFAERLSHCEYVQKSNTRAIKLTDLQRRKNNVIIDQLNEIENENLVDRINEILTVTLRENDRKNVVIRNAYRIGKRKPEQRYPRKVMIQLDNPIGKEILLANSANITKSGNDGRHYYLNQDLPEAERRAKTDLHKYKRYLEEKWHKVEHEGDFFIINDRKWHISQLNNLPIGMRLMDSRTLFGKGTVAFQSSVSPLSNLFVCRIRSEGITFNSTEHAYQYLKCIHHGYTDKANDVRHDPDPYVAMSKGNEITEDYEWASTKQTVMEKLIRCKIDQVPIFRETLKGLNHAD